MSRPFYKKKRYIIPFSSILIMAIMIASILRFNPRAPIPEFRSMSVSERKVAFIDYLIPLINKANLMLQKERDSIISLQIQFYQTGSLSKSGFNTLHTLYVKNRLGTDLKVSDQDFKLLLERVDTIPPSLALAQAALESGWGTSRFAINGNNYFGLHCFTSGCGIIPKRRASGSKMEVTKFNSPEKGVIQYMYRLNTGTHFRHFREIRAKMRIKNLRLETTILMQGLERYSELGGKQYMNLLETVIRQNNLMKYDA